MSSSKAQTAAPPFSILGSRSDLPLFSVKEDKAYDWYGSYKSAEIINEGLAALLGNTDIASPNDLSAVLSNFLTRASEDYLAQKKHERGDAEISLKNTATWFTIRMTKPTSEYTNAPRWHRDGRMYDCDQEGNVNFKYAMTLLGNPTLALHESAVTKEVMQREYGEDEEREKLIEALGNEQQINVGRSDIIKFSWGQDDSPIHSEPDMSTERAFVSMMFGSEGEVRDMCEFREVPFRE